MKIENILSVSHGELFKWGNLNYLMIRHCGGSVMAYCFNTKRQTLIWHNALVEKIGV